MVVWKGEIGKEHGRKAYNLDNVEQDVPNFFVITSGELGEMFRTKNPEEIEEKSIELDKIREAYKEVGMSSEVRNASSRARNLVGGQRSKSKVAVRVSDEGFSDFELDVGASGLEEAIKNVASSYLENYSEMPNLIVQKMIEAEYTGAVVKGRKDYVEVVEGLGIPIEEGTTRPTRYLIGEETRFQAPEQQLKITQNPMTGGYREQRINQPEKPFEDSEIREFSESLSKSVKFAYKRGSFFVIDAFESDKDIDDIEELKVSSGKMEGVVGQEVMISDDTVSPDKYEKGLVARKGSFTSKDAQKARKAGKPAIFSSDREQGESLGGETEKSLDKTLTATEIHSIQELEAGYTHDQAYIESYSEVFSFREDKAILDARIMPREGLEQALKYLEGDIVVLLDTVDQDVILTVVENGFSLGVEESRFSVFEDAVEQAERKFMVEKLRSLE